MNLLELKKKIGRSKSYLILKKIIIKSFYYLPINGKKIVFDNFGGRGYGDDPKYIAEEIRKKYNNDFKLIWLTSDMKSEFPVEIKPVKYGTIRAAYHLSTSKIWIDNIKSSIKVEKKSNQYYIQTWHSTLGFKMNEQDAELLPQKYIREAKKDAAITDLMYSNNDFRIEKYRNRYWYNGEVIKCDVPRMSILFDCPKTLKHQICRKYSINEYKKIVLYAPTFRKDSNIELFKMNYEEVLLAMKKKFGGDFVLLIRLHPNEAIYSKDLISQNSKNIFDLSMYPDMQEILAISDILITDYSGCMFDFGFVEKPVFLFAKDLEKYKLNERKMYFSIEEVPFTIAESEIDLITNINNFNYDEYRYNCNAFKNKIGFNDSGKGAEIITNIIINKIRE
nr:CDP-glycerol glycerophosphotransferase family protein [uncultured Intestinibacter sp.]